MTDNRNKFRKIAVAAARIGDAKKAEPVAVYDLAGTSPLADYAVLMMVESAPQLEAVEEDIVHKLKQEGVFCLHKDGMRSRSWKVLDYGGTLVHIYDTKAAEFYAIDKVYAGCKQVQWEEKPAPAPKEPAVKKAARKPAAKKPAARKTAAKKPAAKKTSKKK
jgi:ribosome-associated protein